MECLGNTTMNKVNYNKVLVAARIGISILDFTRTTLATGYSA